MHFNEDIINRLAYSFVSIHDFNTRCNVACDITMGYPETHVYPLRGFWFVIIGAVTLLAGMAVILEFAGVLFSIKTDSRCDGIQIGSFIVFAACTLYLVSAIMVWLADGKLTKLYKTSHKIEDSSKYQLAMIGLFSASLATIVGVVMYTVMLPDIMSIPTSLDRSCATSQYYLPIVVGVVVVSFSAAGIVLLRPRSYFLYKQSEAMRIADETANLLAGNPATTSSSATQSLRSMLPSGTVAVEMQSIANSLTTSYTNSQTRSTLPHIEFS